MSHCHWNPPEIAPVNNQTNKHTILSNTIQPKTDTYNPTTLTHTNTNTQPNSTFKMMNAKTQTKKKKTISQISKKYKRKPPHNHKFQL